MNSEENILSVSKEFEVRFNEVDSMNIVWHGNYVSYFEQAREEFEKEYGLGYKSIQEAGFYAAIVDIKINYKLPLFYDDKFVIETKFINNHSPKLVFEYTIKSIDNEKVIATAKSTQVLLDQNNYQLEMYTPPFLVEWKKKHNLK